MIKVNIGNSKSGSGYSILNKGKYPFQIVSVNERKSSSGNDMFEIYFEERKSRAKVREFFTIVESQEEKLKNFLSAIGQPCDGELELEGAMWIGLWLIGEVEISEYTKKDGKTGRANKIVAFYPMPSTNDKQVKEDETDIPF